MFCTIHSFASSFPNTSNDAEKKARLTARNEIGVPHPSLQPVRQAVMLGSKCRRLIAFVAGVCLILSIVMAVRFFVKKFRGKYELFFFGRMYASAL
jgi:hypothetical protein